MDKVYIGPMDPPFKVTGDQILECKHFIGAGNGYGRVLFTHDTAVEVSGENNVIRNCVIENFNTVFNFKR